MDGPDGTVAHAELDFGNGRLQLGDPAEAYQIAAPDPNAPATHSIGFYCEDVDSVVAKQSRRAPRFANPPRPLSPATGSPRSSIHSANAGR